jgi:hypothetical protein
MDSRHDVVEIAGRWDVAMRCDRCTIVQFFLNVERTELPERCEAVYMPDPRGSPEPCDGRMELMGAT